MVGVLAAAAGLEDRESLGIDEIVGFGAGASRIDRRVLDQPDLLRCLAGTNRRDPRLHISDGVLIAGQTIVRPPFDWHTVPVCHVLAGLGVCRAVLR